MRELFAEACAQRLIMDSMLVGASGKAKDRQDAADMASRTRRWVVN
jgi:hypothetical protein